MQRNHRHTNVFSSPVTTPVRHGLLVRVVFAAPLAAVRAAAPA